MPSYYVIWCLRPLEPIERSLNTGLLGPFCHKKKAIFSPFLRIYNREFPFAARLQIVLRPLWCSKNQQVFCGPWSRLAIRSPHGPIRFLLDPTSLLPVRGDQGGARTEEKREEQEKNLDLLNSRATCFADHKASLAGCILSECPPPSPSPSLVSPSAYRCLGLQLLTRMARSSQRHRTTAS